ncbi:MAG: molecular chaperone TorD family protein, partial [Actinomycetota bacterium]
MTRDAVVDAALACAARAQLLSLGFGVPTAEAVGRVAACAAVLAQDAAGEERELLAALVAGIDGAAPEDLEVDHARLFDCECPCPPYEGSYEGDPFRQARQMSDVAGFYAAFGARVAGPEGDRPDHVACELEFLSFLALRRAAAVEEGRAEDAEVCGDAEDSFLREHVGRWLGPFGTAVSGAAQTPVYRALGRLAAGFAASELGRRGITPAPLGTRRRWSVEADELVCGAAAAHAPAGGCGGCGPADG